VEQVEEVQVQVQVQEQLQLLVEQLILVEVAEVVILLEEVAVQE
jgi:hypothetical protein